MNTVIQPGSTIGVLGSGQLGRMFTIAAKQMGYRVHVYSPSYDTPAGQVADFEIRANYDDLESVARFARHVDVITLEFENVPVNAVNAAARFAPVHPGAHVLETTQNRIREKTFLRNAGLPVANFQPVFSLSELEKACSNLVPSILKTANGGYDGKGQVTVNNVNDARLAWSKLDTDEAILEERIDFDTEISVVAARNESGMTVCYQPITNLHRNHILDISMSPSCIAPELSSDAMKMAYAVLDELQVVGVICIEFFVTRDGRLIINEIAPRPHNSGHLTVDAHVTSQFEQQVRAVCGLNFGSNMQLKPAAMVNLLGDCWRSGPPNWGLALGMPNVKLHLYGKVLPEPGRKMGHLTAIANSPAEAAEHALAARKLFVWNSFPNTLKGKRNIETGHVD